MPKFEQAEFDKFVIENKVIGFFDSPIILKSGRESNWYVNWRSVAEDAYLLNELSLKVLDFVQDLSSSGRLKTTATNFYGVAEGASKLGILTQLNYAKQSPNFGPNSHPLTMGRGKPKEHGVTKDRYFLGMPKDGVVVLEDVTTTGGSLISSIQQLQESEIKISAAIGLTNRMELRDDGKSVRAALSKLGVDYFEMSKATNLLPQIIKQQKVSPEISAAIAKEFEEYGEEKIGWDKC